MLPLKKNAIEKRLDLLEDLWNGFAQAPGFRLCRWLVTPAESRMIEAFVEFQSEEASDVPDFFIRFNEPFEAPDRYGFILRDALVAKYQEVRPGLLEDGVETHWQCPPPVANESDQAAFLRTLDSFRAECGSSELLVAALLPTRIDEAAAWQAWIHNLMKAPAPAGIRYLVADPVDAPLLGKLAEKEKSLVRTLRPELNMPAAYLELARGDGRIHPGVLFRLNFLALTQAASAGDLAKIKELAAAATGIAQKEGWKTMESVIQMTIASACLSARDVAGALAAYKTAGTAASQAARNGDPAAPKVVLHAKLAEGSALISASQFRNAASVYEEAAAMATQLNDSFLCMESWRMAAYCHEADRNVEKSWRCGNLALDAAEKIKAEDRPKSPLPHVGRGMLRVVGRGNRELTDHVHRRMTALLGREWKPSEEGGTAA
jgi:hypothetical protein